MTAADGPRDLEPLAVPGEQRESSAISAGDREDAPRLDAPSRRPSGGPKLQFVDLPDGPADGIVCSPDDPDCVAEGPPLD